MSNHISLRELAGFAPDIAGAKASLKVLKEACVEVDLRALKEWLSRSQLSAEIHALGVRSGVGIHCQNDLNSRDTRIFCIMQADTLSAEEWLF